MNIPLCLIMWQFFLAYRQSSSLQIEIRSSQPFCKYRSFFRTILILNSLCSHLSTLKHIPCTFTEMKDFLESSPNTPSLQSELPSTAPPSTLVLIHGLSAWERKILKFCIELVIEQVSIKEVIQMIQWFHNELSKVQICNTERGELEILRITQFIHYLRFARASFLNTARICHG